MSAAWRARESAVRALIARLARIVALAAAGAVAACATALAPPASAERDNAVPEAEQIIVAVRDAPEPLPTVGGLPRAGYGSAGYAGGVRAAALAEGIARDHALDRQAAWTIASVGLHCVLYRLPPGADRTAVLARLARDPRVELAQPLNAFETAASAAGTALATAPEAAAPVAPAPLPAGYNDPYVALQRGFTALDAAAAQRWTQGEGVRVALIDTGVDTAHPDLAGRIAAVHDFTPAIHPPLPVGERHGTGMAGLIAAVANNRLGIVGMAPRAQLLVLRACWQLAAAGDAARCDSFSLARALDAAIAGQADIVSLSLGGPADPLLQRLVQAAMQRGAVVVGAVAPGAPAQGFPAGVAGVLGVVSSDDPAATNALAAPGRDILTLRPGGGYDFVSGSSAAAAQVSGAVALLRALQPGLPASTVRAWLSEAGALADACLAVRHLRSAARCGAAAAAGAGR